jgi:eight-cysteine-cluster-containing protein
VKCVCKENPEYLCSDIKDVSVCGPGSKKADYWCPGNGVCCMPSEDICKSHSRYGCYNNHVYWYDSCGKVQDKKEYCQHGCENGACIRHEGFCGTSTEGACSSNADCVEDGCSGQICRSINEEPIHSTCEWRDCYNNEAYGMECGCADGRCKWHAGSNATECKDSDNGKNYYVFGYTEGPTPEGGYASSYDQCYGNVLWEWYCYGGYIELHQYTCPKGCAGGACAQNQSQNQSFCTPTCTDTDDGKDYEAEGSIYGTLSDCISFDVSDSCREYSWGGPEVPSGPILYEAFCGEDKSPRGEFINCPGGCENRACKTAATNCTDSDGGYNMYQKGTATAGNQSLSDHCNQDGTLTEKYCSGIQILWNSTACPGNYTCTDGACLA